MSQAVGVVFSEGGRVYSFDPAGLELSWNEQVICQTARGQELGRVVKANHELERSSTPLKKVVRRATGVDRERLAANKLDEKRALRAFRDALGRRDVRVKPVAADLVFDGSRLTISYQSDAKADLGDLA